MRSLVTTSPFYVTRVALMLRRLYRRRGTEAVGGGIAQSLLSKLDPDRVMVPPDVHGSLVVGVRSLAVEEALQFLPMRPPHDLDGVVEPALVPLRRKVEMQGGGSVRRKVLRREPLVHHHLV